MLTSRILQGPDRVRIAAFVFAIIVVHQSEHVWPFVMDPFVETILGSQSHGRSRSSYAWMIPNLMPQGSPTAREGPANGIPRCRHPTS
jgi:hypothetical protein